MAFRVRWTACGRRTQKIRPFALALAQPSVLLAENGFQITAQEADNLNGEQTNFLLHSFILPQFVNLNKWKEGDWLIQKELGRTLRRIATDGRDGFYKRNVAALIVYEMGKKNGLITLEDLANYHSVWRKPIEFDWNGQHIISMPPPSSGACCCNKCWA